MLGGKYVLINKLKKGWEGYLINPKIQRQERDSIIKHGDKYLVPYEFVFCSYYLVSNEDEIDIISAQTLESARSMSKKTHLIPAPAHQYVVEGADPIYIQLNPNPEYETKNKEEFYITLFKNHDVYNLADNKQKIVAGKFTYLIPFNDVIDPFFIGFNDEKNPPLIICHYDLNEVEEMGYNEKNYKTADQLYITP